jgi:hypothetical protein
MPNVEILKSVISFNREAVVPGNPVLVGGAPRGGTSAVVAILHKLGLNLPREIDHANLEPKVVVNADAIGLLRRIYGDDKRNAYVAEIRASMREDIAAVPNLVWKDPLLGHYLADAIEGLDFPTVLNVSRDPITVMMAEANAYGGRLSRNPTDMPVFSRIYQQMIQSTMNFIANGLTKPSATIFFSYEKLIAFPERSIEELVDVLGLKPTPQQFQEAIAVVQPEAKTPLPRQQHQQA